MALHCPACQTAIRFNQFDTRPRFSVRYRCHVCRLELLLDSESGLLVVAPLPSDELAASDDLAAIDHRMPPDPIQETPGHKPTRNGPRH
jgi:hypothetical protein